MTSPVDPVQQLLKQHDFLEIVELGEGDNKHVRVKCQLTQHEMLPRVDVIEQHLKSKKFIKARDWYCHDYSQYEPYIVPHRKLPKQLYCNITGTILNRIPSQVEKHVQGKRYKRMKRHVKVKVTKTKDDNDEMQNKAEFDADAFEFENSQVIYTDEEEEQNEESDGEVDASSETRDDDLADLYPSDESDKETIAKDSDFRIKEQSKAKRSTNSKIGTKKTRHTTKRAKKTVSSA